MSEVVTEAVRRLNEKMAGQGFDGTAKFVIEEEGSVIIDESGARAGGDDETDVTLTADTDTFRAILDGEENPTAAYMTGKLKLDGDMGTAMRLASVLS